MAKRRKMTCGVIYVMVFFNVTVAGMVYVWYASYHGLLADDYFCCCPVASELIACDHTRSFPLFFAVALRPSQPFDHESN